MSSMKGEEITVLNLLERYMKWVENGEIQFLKEGSKGKNQVLEKVRALYEEVGKARDQKNLSIRVENTDFAVSLDWHEAHKKGRELWQELASNAINDIEPGSKGNSRLFEFLEKATTFEDIIYGLEPYYRDHTLHSLWTYFLGEYIMRVHLPNVHEDLNWYIYNDIEREHNESLQEERKGFHPRELLAQAEKEETDIRDYVFDNRDAIWCVIALCHDLGYSLSKIDALNLKVREVLDFFDLSNFRQIGYALDVEDQYIVSQFLELMALEIRLVPPVYQNSIAGDVIVNPTVIMKSYRDDSTYWRLCRAMEAKRHGILSAYLIYKLLGLFSNSSVRGPAEEWGLEYDEVRNNLIYGGILFAITQHDIKYSQLNQMSSLADILILADEIEEFSRYGRKLLSRRYHDTTANVKIGIEPSKKHLLDIQQGDEIKLTVRYRAAEHLRSDDEFCKFFIHKAKRLCEVYSFGREERDNYIVDLEGGTRKFCSIESLLMEVYDETKSVSILLHKDPDLNRLRVPSTASQDEGSQATCIDDSIIVHLNGDEVFVEEFLEKEFGLPGDSL